MSIQTSLRSFGTALARITGDDVPSYGCWHYTRDPLSSTPYIIWMEIGESDDFHADNGKGEVAMDITIEIYSHDEFDPLFDRVFDFLNDSEIPFSIENVAFEEETKLIHYSITAEMVVDQ